MILTGEIMLVIGAGVVTSIGLLSLRHYTRRSADWMDAVSALGAGLVILGIGYILTGAIERGWV